MEATAGSQLATWGPSSSSGAHVWDQGRQQQPRLWGVRWAPGPYAPSLQAHLWSVGAALEGGRVGWQDAGEGSGQLVQSGRTPGDWRGADRRGGVTPQGGVRVGGRPRPLQGAGLVRVRPPGCPMPSAPSLGAAGPAPCPHCSCLCPPGWATCPPHWCPACP